MKHLILLTLFFLWSTVEAKPVEIVMWHSMAGHLGHEIRQLAAGFNQSQNEYKLKTRL
ncbi:sn-glycerol 3-phosphate ABC transporter substrate-binding protein [Legionella hackeliae]|nr:sn-glycerol 3-phosphate ABC transporter substrate-binding protein [Legionella hackeliae]